MARDVLARFDEWTRTVRDARDAETKALRIGYHSSIDPGLLAAITERFAALRPGRRIELRLGDWPDPAGRVRERQVAAALLPLPVVGQEKLDMHVIREDGRCVALLTGHRLTARSSVTLADLRDERFVALPSASGPLREFWLAVADFGFTPEIAVEIENSEDYFQAIATGRGIAMITESSARVYPRPGIEYRPVTDATPGRLAVVWPADETKPVIRDFVRACVDAVPARDAGHG